jgi:hypothetical protein
VAQANGLTFDRNHNVIHHDGVILASNGRYLYPEAMLTPDCNLNRLPKWGWTSDFPPGTPRCKKCFW